MYHANLFPLIKHNPLPVFTYSPKIIPTPSNKPQKYQILGSVARMITNNEGKAVVSNGDFIECLLEPIANASSPFVVSIRGVGDFSVWLGLDGERMVHIGEFEDYKRLFNRLVDLALTFYSTEFYKFHPDSPYVIKDESYFGSDLIQSTGITDSKKYYRSLYLLQGRPSLLLNRETELRSYGNLFNEIKCLAKRFESISGTSIDIYNPPRTFVEYVNNLLEHKIAKVLRYPGPEVREIKRITWNYRAKDITPGSNKPHTSYFSDTYGITDLDANQPLVVYEVGIEQIRTQYHIPELLSIGHTLRDLERRVPQWQRPQVWDIIQPDCKNQLQKIYDIAWQVDSTLRKSLPGIYPRLIEFSLNQLEVSSWCKLISEIDIKFFRKIVKVKKPFDIDFYRKYSDTKIRYVNPMPNLSGLVHLAIQGDGVDDFLEELKLEYKLRSGSELNLVKEKLNFQERNYTKYDLTITITSEDDEQTRGQCKLNIQNKDSKVHQHITLPFMTRDSIMQLIMELALKFGYDPWLLKDAYVSTIYGIHQYRSPTTGRQSIFALKMNGQGKLLSQFDPNYPEDANVLVNKILENQQPTERVLYLFSFDKAGVIQMLADRLASSSEEKEYCIAEIIDEDQIRLFETWFPKAMPKFGKEADQKYPIVKTPIEAYASAPQGLVFKAEEDTYFLVTGRTIERNALRRGCPTPIKVIIRKIGAGQWDKSKLIEYIFALCLMGRASGHLTRFPSPLYYLHLYAQYNNEFGLPADPVFRQRVFYI